MEERRDAQPPIVWVDLIDEEGEVLLTLQYTYTLRRGGGILMVEGAPGEDIRMYGARSWDEVASAAADDLTTVILEKMPARVVIDHTQEGEKLAQELACRLEALGYTERPAPPSQDAE